MQILHPPTEPEVYTRPVAFDAREARRELLRSWRFLLGSAVLAALVSLGISFLVHTTYKAMALVLPPDQNNSTLSMLSAATGSSGIPASALAAFGMKKPTDLYVALMSSPIVEDAVIQRFGLQQLYGKKHLSQARKKFESNAQIKPDEKSGLISVTVIDRDPNRAAQIANGLIDAFDQLSSHLAITDAARRRMFFEKEVTQTKVNLTSAEDTLHDTIKKTGMLEPEGNARAMIAYQAQLRAEIAAKNVELQSKQVFLSDENPQVQTARREKQALEAQASSLDRSTDGDASDSKYMASDASLAYLRNLREVRYNEALLELLLKNLELAKLDEAREGNLVQVVQPATPPDMKYGPHHSLFLACGFVIGLLLSAAWILMSRFLIS